MTDWTTNKLFSKIYVFLIAFSYYLQSIKMRKLNIFTVNVGWNDEWQGRIIYRKIFPKEGQWNFINMKKRGTLNLKLCGSRVWQACTISTFSCWHWGNPLMNFDPWTRLPIEPILKRSVQLTFRRLRLQCNGMRAGRLCFILGRSEVLLFAATWDRL